MTAKNQSFKTAQPMNGAFFSERGVAADGQQACLDCPSIFNSQCSLYAYVFVLAVVVSARASLSLAVLLISHLCRLVGSLCFKTFQIISSPFNKSYNKIQLQSNDAVIEFILCLFVYPPIKKRGLFRSFRQFWKPQHETHRSFCRN